MSSTQPNINPVQQAESKSAKKKKAKAGPAAQASVNGEAEATTVSSPTEPVANGTETHESPYVKELQKNIRAVKKKLNAMQKVDAIIADNPDTSLDDLLSSKKINIDQKAQVQKKPLLQSQLAQLEEQLSQYKLFDEEHQKQLHAEKEALEAAHAKELENIKESVTAEVLAESNSHVRDNLLRLSRFLRAAAGKRQSGDESSSENRAFEGALLLLYGGDNSAVDAMMSLINGSEDLVPTVDSTLTDFTYKQLSDIAFVYDHYADDQDVVEGNLEAEANTGLPQAPLEKTEEISQDVSTDPTVAHAGLTELETGPRAGHIGVFHHNNRANVPATSSIDAGAANATGENNWGADVAIRGGEGEPSGGENVQVDRDPAETETGTAATPAALTGTQSWAEEVPVASGSQGPSAGDGFREVQNNHRGRGRGGEDRGGDRRGRGGHNRERGGGGRGRGGARGDRGDRGERGGGRARGGRGRGARPGGGEA